MHYLDRLGKSQKLKTPTKDMFQSDSACDKMFDIEYDCRWQIISVSTEQNLTQKLYLCSSYNDNDPIQHVSEDLRGIAFIFFFLKLFQAPSLCPFTPSDKFTTYYWSSCPWGPQGPPHYIHTHNPIWSLSLIRLQISLDWVTCCWFLEVFNPSSQV